MQYAPVCHVPAIHVPVPKSKQKLRLRYGVVFWYYSVREFENALEYRYETPGLVW